MGTAVPVRRKDLLFDRRVCYQERQVFARETFSLGFREITKQLPVRHARSLAGSGTQISVQPRGGRGARGDSGATA